MIFFWIGDDPTLGQQGEIQFFLAEAYSCAFEIETAKSAGRVRLGSQVNMLFKSLCEEISTAEIDVHSWMIFHI